MSSLLLHVWLLQFLSKHWKRVPSFLLAYNSTYLHCLNMFVSYIYKCCWSFDGNHVADNTLEPYSSKLLLIYFSVPGICILTLFTVDLLQSAECLFNFNAYKIQCCIHMLVFSYLLYHDSLNSKNLNYSNAQYSNVLDIMVSDGFFYLL